MQTLSIRPSKDLRTHDAQISAEANKNHVAIPVNGRGYGAMIFRPDGSLVVYAYNVHDECHMDWAISRDGGTTWRWLNADGKRHEPNNAFDYTFGADENETRFAVAIPYTQTEWDAASARWRGQEGVKFGTRSFCAYPAATGRRNGSSRSRLATMRAR